MGNAARSRQLMGDDEYFKGNPLWGARKTLGASALDATRQRMIRLLTQSADLAAPELEELALFVPDEVIRGLAQYIDADPDLPTQAESGIPDQWPDSMRAAADYLPSRQWASQEARNVAGIVGLHRQNQIHRRWLAVISVAAIALNHQTISEEV
jgi:hypothetical protein